MLVVLEGVNPQEPADPAESVSVQNAELTPEPESMSSDVADPKAAINPNEVKTAKSSC